MNKLFGTAGVIMGIYVGISVLSGSNMGSKSQMF